MAGVDPFHAEHADVALLDALDEMRDRGLAEIDRREIENDRLTEEEIRRARKRSIDLFEPTDDRHDWSKNKGDVRASAQANELTCRFDAGFHDDRLAHCYAMVNRGRSWLMEG